MQWSGVSNVSVTSAIDNGLRKYKGRALAFGYLQSLVADPKVTDIAVTSDGRVWADRGSGMKEQEIKPGFASPEIVKRYAVQLCSQLGKRLDDSCPIADASTPDGLRIHAVIAPIVLEGAVLSIRLPHRQEPDLQVLVAAGLCPSSWIYLLQAMIVNKASIMIAGGTGSGKTTLLRALLRQCLPHERIVSVEEVREIGVIPGHTNHVSLAVREANVEGAGAVGLCDLVKATLRMRPDRIVLGECRGEEIADLLRAFNSGHQGGMVTIHADGVEGVPARLATLGLLAGLQPPVLASLMHGAFDVVIYLEHRQKRRWISQIGILTKSSEGGLLGKMVCAWDGLGKPVYSSLWPVFAQRWGVVTSHHSKAKEKTSLPLPQHERISSEVVV